MHWSDGRLFVLNSLDSSAADPAQWVPQRSSGDSVETLADPRHVRYVGGGPFDGLQEGRQWLEATWKDSASGTLYGWFHNEPWGTCPGLALTSPRIGAVRSFDDGLTWEHLGLILVAPGEPDCATPNGYFAGGNGDFSVMLDAAGEYFYFFFSSFAGGVDGQGIALAWMAAADRDAPGGKVYKWNDGDWYSPGIGGAASPILRVNADWMSEAPDAFWGPSIHWNRYLEEYVILLNRAITPTWQPEGVYAIFATRLDDPAGWSEPVRLTDADGWYPQVVGLDAGNTDKSAGRVARFFLAGRSDRTIDFGELRAWLGVDVGAAGIAVSARGHERNDLHQAVTGAHGRAWFPGLVPHSRYEVVVTGGPRIDDVELSDGPGWTVVDAPLAL